MTPEQIVNNKQNKDYRIDIVPFLQKSTKKTIKGYASAFYVKDQQKDVILPGAFEESVLYFEKKGFLPLLWQHQASNPIGKVIVLKEDRYGLYFEAILTKGVCQSEEASYLLEDKVIDSLSIGFQIQKSHINKVEKIREISKVRLLEISLVTFPANQNAKIYWYGES